MLSALRNADHDARSAALMAAARSLLPEPSETTNVPTGLAAQVIGEIAGKIRVDKGEVFTTALKQRLLLKELQDEILDGADRKDIRARMGHKGLLSSSQYDVQFGEYFLGACVGMGVTKSLAERAIRNPSSLEHLFPDDAGLLGVQPQSLFSAPVFGLENCWVVVLTIRDDATLFVDGGWLVFLDDVGVSPHATPSAMLNALAEKYGHLFKVGSFEGKFLQLKVLEHITGTMFEWEANHRAIDTRISWSLSPGTLKIGLAFSLDIADYITDLRKHGVRVTRKVEPGPHPNLYVQLK